MGVSYPLLEFPPPCIPHQEKHWLSTMRDFLSDMNVSIFIDGAAVSIPQPLRQGDVCLMDAILSVPGTSTAHLRVFNRCRICFGVVFVSEIATANGTSISRDTWEGGRSHVSPLLWPYQPQPGSKLFWVWRRLLVTAFLQGHRARVSSRTRNLDLGRPLGRWLLSSDTFWYHWTSFFSSLLNSLFLLSADDAGFHKHPAKKPRRRPKHPVRAFSADPTTWVATLPPDAIPVNHHAEPNELVFPDVISTVSPSPLTPVSPVSYMEGLRCFAARLGPRAAIIRQDRRPSPTLQSSANGYTSLPCFGRRRC
jgi:hypothetical protein